MSRAFHFEMCFSLSSNSFCSAFRRFISIRGPASLLRCDQGTNFMGAYNDILKLGCEMIPNPPASSHRGGAWERMVEASRRVIEGILMDHGTQLDDEGLLTILHEAANIVNSRPLNIHNINDPNLEPLNANQLLNMKSGVVIAPPTLSSKTSDLYALKRWKRVQYLANLFWSRWKTEILMINQSRGKWNKPRRYFQINDIVIIVNESVERSSWKMARVVDIKPSEDGFIRSVGLILSDRSYIRRPVQKLFFPTDS